MHRIVTHDGKFHADDVFAVAALLLLFKKRGVHDYTLLRTRDPERIRAADVVVDVGGVYDPAGNRFDHHQIGGAGVRENGIPYASFGLLWKQYGKEIAGSAPVAHRIDTVLVAPVDAQDNGVDLSIPTRTGVSPYEISDAIRSFIPTWHEETKDMESSFHGAVAFAMNVLVREMARAAAAEAGKEKVEASYMKAADKRLIVLDEDYSWKDILSRFPEPLYVVHPQNDTWRLYSVRDNPHVFANRKDLPEEWAGLRGEELQKLTGVPDALFCHRNRFMAVTQTKEGALALAKRALDS